MKKLACRLIPFVLAASAGAAFAQEAPAGGAESVTFARLSIASIDAVNKLLTDLEAPTADPLIAELERLPFLGAGAVAHDKPLGLLLTASPNAPLFSPQAVVAAVPLAAGKATADDLTKAGAKPVEGKTDTVTLEDMTLRRTANYLFGQGGANPALAGFSDTPFASDYRTPTNLLVAVLDLAKLRTGAPNAYKQLTAAPALLPLPDAADAPKAFAEALAKIDRVTFAFARDDKNLHLQFWQMPLPFAAKAIQPKPRPAFPAGVIAQMHVIYPDAETAHWLDRQLDEMQEASIPGPPDKKPQIKALLKRLAKFNGQAEAVSMAITMQDKLPLVYVVDQLREDLDLATEIQGIATDLKAVAAEEVKADVTTYDAGGKTVQRLALTSTDGSDKVFVDALQQGKTIYFAFSGKEDKVVESLAGAGMKGTSNALCAGVLDLTAALNAASSGAGGPLSDLPPDALAGLKTAFAGQGITWTAQGAEAGGNYLYFDLAVPFNAAREVGRVIKAMNNHPAGQ
jgi:hypothetical protein